MQKRVARRARVDDVRVALQEAGSLHRLRRRRAPVLNRRAMKTVASARPQRRFTGSDALLVTPA